MYSPIIRLSVVFKTVECILNNRWECYAIADGWMKKKHGDYNFFLTIFRDLSFYFCFIFYLLFSLYAYFYRYIFFFVLLLLTLLDFFFSPNLYHLWYLFNFFLSSHIYWLKPIKYISSIKFFPKLSNRKSYGSLSCME